MDKIFLKNMKTFQCFFSLTIGLIVHSGCIDNRDPFYTTKGGWDYQRIPLIKPYFAINTGDGWTINKPYDKSDGISKIITDVTHIQVADSIIFFRWYQDTSNTNKPDSTWGYLYVSFGVESIFTDEQIFNDSTKKIILICQCS